MNKKLLAKVNQIAAKKEKIKLLETEIAELQAAIDDAKNREFLALSKRFFAETNADKKAALEAKIKNLMGE